MYIQPQPNLLNPHRSRRYCKHLSNRIANALGVGVVDAAVGHNEAFGVAGNEGAERDVVGLR